MIDLHSIDHHFNYSNAVQNTEAEVPSEGLSNADFEKVSSEESSNFRYNKFNISSIFLLFTTGVKRKNYFWAFFESCDFHGSQMEGYSYWDSPSGKAPFRARPSLTVLHRAVLCCTEKWSEVKWSAETEEYVFHKLRSFLDLRFSGVINRLLQLCNKCNLENTELEIVPFTTL